jgi:sugar phosphate isomerase/epimerase
LRFGVCASDEARLSTGAAPVDFFEASVQTFLAPEAHDEAFGRRLLGIGARDHPIEAANVFIPATLPLIESRTQPVDHARLQRYVRTALSRAEQSGISLIVFGSGKARACPPDLSPLDARRQLQERLEHWARWAQDHGVQIALEPLRREETNLVNTVAEGGELISRVGGSGVSLAADLYHMASSGEDPESIRPWVPLISHVHVAEREGRAAPGTHGEDLRPYLRVLAEEGYNRRISIECRWEDFASQLGPAIATLRAQWRDVVPAGELV